MEPSRVVVLADDLTSAADGAVPFRRSGHRALVLFDPPEPPGSGAAATGVTAPRITATGVTAPRITATGGSATGAAATGAAATGVTAVDLGTRLLDATEAAARMKGAARAYAGADLLLKTVDSTLRGHVAAELRAALAGSGRRAAVVAPAFPAEGRTTVRGVQYVRGVRVDESEFARDPAHPVRSADLTRLLPESTVVAPDRLAGLAELLSRGGVFVCSAATEEDLDAVVAAVPRVEEVLWVGSPGLAAALARRHGRARAAGFPGLPPVRRPLAVVGSANPASRRQLDALYVRSGADGAVADDPAAAVAALSASRAPVLALHTPDARGADPAALTRRLAETAAEAVGKGLADGLVLTGGETAAAVLDVLGATGIDLHDEPEPGIARGTLHGPAAPRIPVLVKAGGFGDDGTLVRLCALLTGGEGR
ncbi:four-carbon acid sugar kinase family protein [Streptomyces sp. NPDC051079]|uniref:four-carbon acid sugar kinase family protein n=1 Tax=Streptomyces sp. NPDC051079 TaxID=3155043 RepID=UPI003450A9DD